MNNEEFAKRVESVRTKLYKTALTYLGSEALAMDAVDEAVYKALCGKWKLRQPEFFDTWITRILINECHNELRRQKRFHPLEELPETAEGIRLSAPERSAAAPAQGSEGCHHPEVFRRLHRSRNCPDVTHTRRHCCHPSEEGDSVASAGT